MKSYSSNGTTVTARSPYYAARKIARAVLRIDELNFPRSEQIEAVRPTLEPGVWIALTPDNFFEIRLNEVCRDCGRDTAREYYKVHDSVWAQTGLGPKDGELCIGCLEKRIGRRLQPQDFPPANINKLHLNPMLAPLMAQRLGPASKRLLSRMRSKGTVT
jgi:hypothetical protein